MIQWDTFLLFTSNNKRSQSSPREVLPNDSSEEAQPVIMQDDKDDTINQDDCPNYNNTHSECNDLASEIYVDLRSQFLAREAMLQLHCKLEVGPRDLIRIIKDPEKPQTLEELNVVQEKGITVTPINGAAYLVRIEFVPTVPHCSLATLIGLCLRVKLERNLPHKFKLDIVLQEGSHATELEINKQINDKERIAAAMENPNLREVVENCVQDEN